MATLKASSGSNKILGSLGLAGYDNLKLVKVSKSGLPFTRLADLAKRTGLSFAELSRVLGIPPRTLARRKSHGILLGPETERLLRLARLVDRAADLFEGDMSAALTWLRTPAKGLGNLAPLTLAETEIGSRAVEDLIGRLEFGVYS